MNLRQLCYASIVLMGMLIQPASQAADHSIQMVASSSSMSSHNPCAMKNPCNPDAMKNPCASNSSEYINPEKYLRPAGTKPYHAGLFGKKKLLRYGKKLFNDTSLSSNGLSCNACHATDGLFKTGFSQPYPHKVKMTAQFSNYKQPVELEEFVQFCMIKPMKSKAFAWDSRELSALTAYMKKAKHEPFMQLAMANPCSMKNHGMGGNPCAMKNPCAMRHSW